MAIPTGIPLIYKFNRNLEPVHGEDGLPALKLAGGVTGTFLEERGLLRRALAQEQEWLSSVPGYGSISSTYHTRVSNVDLTCVRLFLPVSRYAEVMGPSDRSTVGLTPYVRSLSKLKVERVQLKRVATLQAAQSPREQEQVRT